MPRSLYAGNEAHRRGTGTAGKLDIQPIRWVLQPTFSRLRKRGLANSLPGVIGRQLRRLGGGCLIMTHAGATGKALTQARSLHPGTCLGEHGLEHSRRRVLSRQPHGSAAAGVDHDAQHHRQERHQHGGDVQRQRLRAPQQRHEGEQRRAVALLGRVIKNWRRCACRQSSELHTASAHAYLMAYS